MDDIWLVILGLAAATFSIRMAGAMLGARLPQSGAWARILQTLPGCLIVALVSVSLLSGGPNEWIAGAIAAAVAILSRSLLATMAIGITAIWFLRHFVVF